jgi:uncharacterized RDD family membrane protein YckC
MNTYGLRRLMPITALMLCAGIAIAHAQPAKPSTAPAAAPVAAPVAAPAAAPTAAPAELAAASAAITGSAASDNDGSDKPDWDSHDEDHEQDGSDRRHRHGSHSRRDSAHRNHGNDLVSIGHDSHLPQGQKADSVVSIAGSSTSEGDADTVVSVLGNTRVTGPVSDSAVAVLGDAHVDSKIEGDVVAVLGDIELGPHADIGGDVVAVGGKVLRDPAAIVHGDIHDILAGNFGSMGWLSTWVQHCLLYGRPLALAPGLGWAWSLAFTCLALYILLALLFRPGLTQCVRTFESQPGRTLLAALIAMLLTPVLVVLLCVTVIGIAAVPFVLFALFCAGLFGKAVMLAWIGKRVVGERTAGVSSHPAFAVLIGGLIVLLLYLVPVLGFLVYKVLGILGLGAVVYTLILAARAHRAANHSGPETATPRSAPFAGAAPIAGAAPMADAAGVAGAAASATPVSDATSAPSAAPLTGAASAFAAAETPTTGPSAAGGQAGTPNDANAAGRSSAPGPAGTPVTAALPRAGFWIRMVALLLDVLLVGFATSLLHPLFRMHLLLLAVYGAVMWKLRGSTIGGTVFDLRVVRLDGRPMDWETAIIRALSCFLSLAVAGLGFFWIAFDGAHQAWHDKIAGTVVVRVPKGVPLV